MNRPAATLALLLAPSFALPRPSRAASTEPAAGFIDGYPPQVALEAMDAEMKRSLERLKLDSFGPPYYLAYRLTTEGACSIAATYGATAYRSRLKRNILYVGARVGSPALDSTDRDYNGPSGQVAVVPDLDSLRHALWSLSDEAYKDALSSFLRKKARMATELDKDQLPDLSSATAVQASVDDPVPAFDTEALEKELREVSAVFKKDKDVISSQVHADLTWSQRILVTSEGTRLVTPYENAPTDIVMVAMGRAPDGMQVEDSRRWTARGPADAPSVETLKEAAKGLAEEIGRLRRAELQSPVSAPAIIDPEFTGVFFHEALGHKLEGERQRDPEESQVFKDRIGTPVMPSFLSLLDDPTMKDFNGVPLHGHYDFDSEGTPAGRVVLIDHGVLKTFLMSRWPLKTVTASNGHGRADPWRAPIGRMANLIVQAHQTESLKTLKKMLLKECQARGKEYGFILRGSLGGDNPNEKVAPQTLRVTPRLVYRVDAKTGKETLVRGVEFVGTPLVVVNKILAAGDDMTLSNPYNCGSASGWVAVDQIAPSVLLSEVELQRVPERRQRPPILPAPLFDKDKEDALP